MEETTLLWHDYETWGLNPRLDRPAQFAAIRTNLNLEIIGEPINLYCKPATDFIPSPQSALITRLTPQKCAEKGLCEADFFDVIHKVFSEPNTCGVGYNSLRFDDEVTRFGFYRNFHDAYAREWQNGNSRWDLVDLVRMTYALRPEGIIWPEREPGIPSFRLDQLSVANGIGHEAAHDALSDVHATIGLAKLILEKQPKLFHYYLAFRSKQRAAREINLNSKDVFLHVSGMYPSSQGCIAPVMPLAQHPRNKNEFIVFDLRESPDRLLTQSASKLAENLFTPKDQLPEGQERLPLKGIHINKSPALAPKATLNKTQADKWGIDWVTVEKHRQQILAEASISTKVQKIYTQAQTEHAKQDADVSLYGGFAGSADKKMCQAITGLAVSERLALNPIFEDERFQTIYPRYLGRNWPEQLSEAQQTSWLEYKQQRLIEGELGDEQTLDHFFSTLDVLEQDIKTDEDRALIDAVIEWVETQVAQDLD